VEFGGALPVIVAPRWIVPAFPRVQQALVDSETLSNLAHGAIATLEDKVTKCFPRLRAFNATASVMAERLVQALRDRNDRSCAR
jgi:hypothetical protein